MPVDAAIAATEPSDLFLLAGGILVVAIAIALLSTVVRWLFGPDGLLGVDAAYERQLRRDRDDKAQTRRETNARHAALNATDDELRDLWRPKKETRR